MHMQFRYAFRNVNVDLIKRMKEKKKDLVRKIKDTNERSTKFGSLKFSQRLNDDFVNSNFRVLF